MNFTACFFAAAVRRAGLAGLLTWCACAVAANDPTGAMLRAAIDPYVANQSIAGAVVMVATPEKVLTQDAIGWMDIAQSKAMRTDTVFWIASQTKPITAAAAMVLVDDGKISLDDPIEKFLPEFKELWVKGAAEKEKMMLAKARRSILVRDLLAHTSGLAPYSPIEEPAVYDLFSLRTRTLAYTSVPLDAQPGEKWAYANAGYNTLARTIEVVSGMPYAQFMDERIFRPLGMSDTTFWPSEAQAARLAKSYKSEPAGLVETPIHVFRYPLTNRERQPLGGGGLFSTAKDLSNFYRMLTSEGVFEGRRILSAASVKLMTTDQTGSTKHAYGFGLHLRKNTFGHAGAYGSNTVYDRDTGLITIFLVQQAGWKKGGEKVGPDFQKAAAAAFPRPPKT